MIKKIIVVAFAGAIIFGALSMREKEPEEDAIETTAPDLTECYETVETAPKIAETTVPIEIEPFVEVQPAHEIPEGYEFSYIIWDYLKSYGYNDYVVAGIMGNIMRECGGGTFKLNPKAYNPTGYYYGICQWNKGSYKRVHGKELIEQLDFLVETIKTEFDTYGPAFKTSYDRFCGLQDEQDAAIMFARVYERCSSDSYGRRQKCATKALDYFSTIDFGY